MDIKNYIPQREPFLFINKIEGCDETSIKTSYTFTEDQDFFKGHFPGNPVVPGVILNEHCLQSGAAFIGVNETGSFEGKLAVASRIQSAKFKNLVIPNDTITSTTKLVDRIANAAFFRSTVVNQNNQKVLTIEFSVAVVDPQ